VERARNPAGNLVRDARLRSRLSQRQLARRAGTSQAAISRIERGLEEPTLERLEQILAGLGWKLELSLEPIEVHDEEPFRLHRNASEDPSALLEGGLNWLRFGNDVRAAGERARAEARE
jgi:transcriptional regulator with XRE-family HTH domain